MSPVLPEGQEVKLPLDETTLEFLVGEEEVTQVDDDLRRSPTVTTDDLDALIEEEEKATTFRKADRWYRIVRKRRQPEMLPTPKIRECSPPNS